ncbi:MAG: hypothetical protein ACD_3C00225G0014 [uncultured bacterium (gcode 4)]|uniref:Protein-L-isoaspartate O-methyltransferase n=1 Tax=uncultured bacterium (gcode 4) TaxID=1234023 RepID=K2F812_9BACT|nr:MAG: hypothetical protein ACD_3C00225G0014 [uncultured bacterium (gcode 4)]
MRSYDQDSMIDELISMWIPKNSSALKAFKAVDRRYFVPDEYASSIYDDMPLPIWHGQTISQPYTVAFMLELLDVKKWNHILDIGSWSGWTTALLAYICWNDWYVIWLEIIPDLVDTWQANLSKFNFKNARIMQALPTLWIPWKKFDRILVSAAWDELDDNLLWQLNDWGILVIPINYSIWKIVKIKEDNFEKREYPWFTFVPLIK